MKKFAIFLMIVAIFGIGNTYVVMAQVDENGNNPYGAEPTPIPDTPANTTPVVPVSGSNPAGASPAASPVGQQTGTPVGQQTGNKATSGNQKITPLMNPLNATSVKDVILLIVNIAIYVGVAFAILAIIFVGFKFVAAQGKPDALKEAKEWFLWIIVGLAILISSKVMVEIVKTTLINSNVVDKSVFNQNI